MKNVLFVILFSFAKNTFSQVFWTETFNNGCASGCLANGMNTGNGAWSVVSLAGDASAAMGDMPNDWYVSCAENGHTNTVCGSGCVALSAINTLASLHIGSTSIGDLGAAYDAGGLCGIWWCTNTHKRVQSPLISTVGKTGITISFNYIELGQTTSDDMYAVQYSTNGGTTWTTLSNPAKTTCCGGACNGSLQGKWSTFTSATLPVAAENIANFRLAFVWKNNDDGVGADPSFAMDNLTLSSTAVLPIELVDFTYVVESGITNLIWKTASEKNSSHYEIQKSEDGVGFMTIGKVDAAFNSSHMSYYSFKDNSMNDEIVYYRLKIVDTDGTYQFSKRVVIEPGSDLSNNYYINDSKKLVIKRNYFQANDIEYVSIIDTEGKTVANYSLTDVIREDHAEIPVQGLTGGIYLCHLKGNSAHKSFKFYLPY